MEKGEEREERKDKKEDGENGHHPEDGATRRGQTKTTRIHRHGGGKGDPSVFEETGAIQTIGPEGLNGPRQNSRKPEQKLTVKGNLLLI